MFYDIKTLKETIKDWNERRRNYLIVPLNFIYIGNA